jgi:hypothetical protein
MVCDPLPTLFGVIKSRKKRWAGRVAYMRREEIQNFDGNNLWKESTWNIQA